MCVLTLAAVVTGVSSIAEPAAAPDARHADAATWRWVGLPNVTDHPDSGHGDDRTPPQRIGWPGEGTSTTGVQDPACPLGPPYRNGRRMRTGAPLPTDELVGVLGIWKRGGFVRVGAPTPGANHAPNHLATFFHTPDLDGLPCFRGGSEYGFLRNLGEGSTRAGDQPLNFYQCQDCNCKPDCVTNGGGTVPERYTSRMTGWRDAERDLIYRVSFRYFSVDSAGVRCASATDDFYVEVLDPAVWPPALRLSAKICRASWMPDVKGGDGWITVNAHADGATADGVDHFDGSYNDVTTVTSSTCSPSTTR
jgi:hypothetical protein